MKGSSSAVKSPRMERVTNFKVVVRVRPPLHRELNGEVIRFFHFL